MSYGQCGFGTCFMRLFCCVLLIVCMLHVFRILFVQCAMLYVHLGLHFPVLEAPRHIWAYVFRRFVAARRSRLPLAQRNRPGASLGGPLSICFFMIFWPSCGNYKEGGLQSDACHLSHGNCHEYLYLSLVLSWLICDLHSRVPARGAAEICMLYYR